MIHVYGSDTSDEFVDCRWRVYSQVLGNGMLPWWTVRRRSLDSNVPNPLPAGPRSSGLESIPTTGRIGF